MLLSDTIKNESKKTIKELRRRGIHTILLSGDSEKAVKSVADEVGFDSFYYRQLPDQKLQKVEEIINNKKKGTHVAFVGDGINDAPALAQADVGIAIGSGTDVAMESADIVLMKSDIIDVVTALELSKSTIRNIKQNLFWAFAYNSAGIPLAAGLLFAFGGPKLNPMFAAGAMSFSSISVLLNALRLKRFKPSK